MLTGKFAADNSATINLNGAPVGPTASTYDGYTAFTISGGFVAGVNTLDFVVINGAGAPNPTGLRVDISGTANGSGGGVSVGVSPSSVSLQASQTQTFTATVTGTGNTAVTWSINPAIGTIVNGLYTAPATIASAQTVTVTATSVADNTKSGTAIVNLVPPATGPTAIAVLGTGVVSAGVLAADGTVDPHYRLVASADGSYPGPNAIVVTSNAYPIPPWLADGPASKWIGPRADAANGNLPGGYTYRTTFDLTGLNPATAVLTGQFAADNSAVIKLNGVVVGPTSPTYDSYASFTINTGFISGVNTLEFVVTNSAGGSNPTGLRVNISGTATP